MDWQKINVNWLVRVRLTDHGRAAYARWMEKINLPVEYRTPKEEMDGWSEWQMWGLMEIFGDHMGMCKPLCFDTSIEIRLE